MIIIWFCQSSETFRCVVRLYQSMWLGFAFSQLRGEGSASLVVHVHMHAELWPFIKSALLNSKTNALNRTVLVGPQGEGRGTLLLGIFAVRVHCLGKSDVRSVPCHTVPDTQCPFTLLPVQLSSDKAQQSSELCTEESLQLHLIWVVQLITRQQYYIFLKSSVINFHQAENVPTKVCNSTGALTGHKQYVYMLQGLK